MMNAQRTLHTFYKKLLRLYPRAFRERLEESMEQTFNDLYKERETKPGRGSFVLWMFSETAVGIAGEHMRLIMEGAMMKNISTSLGLTALISSILLAVAFLVAPLIYLVGNLRDALGPLSYNIADFLYGPVWGAGLVTMVFVLRERIGIYAPRRMSLALMTALLAAGTMILIACIRSANRQYHLLHPELHLEDSIVIVAWTTLVAGLTGAGFHFLGWTLTLIGSVGWTSRQLPRLLSVLYLVIGITSLFVYLLPDNEGFVATLGVVVSIWQGILLWRGKPQETQAPDIPANQPDPA